MPMKLAILAVIYLAVAAISISKSAAPRGLMSVVKKLPCSKAWKASVVWFASSRLYQRLKAYSVSRPWLTMSFHSLPCLSSWTKAVFFIVTMVWGVHAAPCLFSSLGISSRAASSKKHLALPYVNCFTTMAAALPLANRFARCRWADHWAHSCLNHNLIRHWIMRSMPRYGLYSAMVALLPLMILSIWQKWRVMRLSSARLNPVENAHLVV